MQPTTYGGNKYFLILTASHQRYLIVYLFKRRSKKPKIAFTLSHNLITTRNKTWNSLHSDNASEFLGLHENLNKIGIELTTLSAYSPQDSCLAEHMNRSLLNKGHAMLHCKAYTNKLFWGEALLQAVFLHNRTVTPVLNMKTPQEVLLKNAPNNSKIRILGCAENEHRHITQRTDKLDYRSIPGVYLGSLHGMYLI